MNNDEILKEYKCALSSSLSSHFISAPISLECGHNACKSCLEECLNKDLKCKRCNKPIDRSNLKFQENTFIKKLIEFHADYLLEDIEKKLSLSFNELKDFLNGHEKRIENIETQIEFSKHEVVLRIESIKMQLDKISEKFLVQLDDLKKNMINDEKSSFNEASSLSETLTENLVNLKNIVNEKSKNSEMIYKFQDELIYTEHLLALLDSLKFEVSFNPSKDNVFENIVGYLIDSTNGSSCKEKIQNQKIMKLLKGSSFDVIKLDAEQREFCILNNNTFVFRSAELALYLYDDKFKLIKKVLGVDNQLIEVYGMACDSIKNRIYITDYQNDQVIMMDSELKKVKAVGIQGTEKCEFDTPAGICYENNYLFVCDRKNKRIQVFTSELEFDELYNLEYEPCFIKVIGSVACVSPISHNYNYIYFYDSDNFTIKFKYEGHIGRISAIGSYFYEFSFNGKIYVYDDQGNMLTHFEKKEFSDSYGGFVCMGNDEQAYILRTGASELVKLKI